MLCLKSLCRIVAASPPRCEAGLCLAVKKKREIGLCPSYGLWPKLGEARTEGTDLHDD